MCTKKTTAVIPLIYERAFDYVINQDKDNLEYFLSSILNLKLNDIKDKVSIISNNAPLKKKTEKRKRMDFVYKIGNICINIELNTNPHESYKRNTRYLASLHAREVNISEDYKDYETIQININKNNFGRTKSVKRKIYLKDEKTYDESMKIYVINLPNLEKMWYTDSKQVVKNQEVLICFFMEELESYENLRKNERIDRIMKRMEEFSKNEKEWISYRDENEIELTHNYGLRLAREEGERRGVKKGRKEGIVEGRKEGIAEGIHSVALNMIKEDTDINTIMKFTGLSKKEIMALK